MPAARRVTVDLSEDHARGVDDRIASGRSSTVGEVLSAGLDALLDEEIASQLPDMQDLDDATILEACAPGLERLKHGRDHLLTTEQVFGKLTEAALARRKPR